MGQAGTNGIVTIMGIMSFPDSLLLVIPRTFFVARVLYRFTLFVTEMVQWYRSIAHIGQVG